MIGYRFFFSLILCWMRCQVNGAMRTFRRYMSLPYFYKHSTPAVSQSVCSLCKGQHDQIDVLVSAASHLETHWCCHWSLSHHRVDRIFAFSDSTVALCLAKSSPHHWGTTIIVPKAPILDRSFTVCCQNIQTDGRHVLKWRT